MIKEQFQLQFQLQFQHFIRGELLWGLGYRRVFVSALGLTNMPSRRDEEGGYMTTSPHDSQYTCQELERIESRHLAIKELRSWATLHSYPMPDLENVSFWLVPAVVEKFVEILAAHGDPLATLIDSSEIFRVLAPDRDRSAFDCRRVLLVLALDRDRSALDYRKIQAELMRDVEKVTETLLTAS